MAPPSKLAVATGSVTRLVKEEASYHKEIVQQHERIKKLEASEGDDNKEYTLRQEVRLHTVLTPGVKITHNTVETSTPGDSERLPSCPGENRTSYREA
jgi:hypothetical protein